MFSWTLAQPLPMDFTLFCHLGAQPWGELWRWSSDTGYLYKQLAVQGRILNLIQLLQKPPEGVTPKHILGLLPCPHLRNVKLCLI